MVQAAKDKRKTNTSLYATAFKEVILTLHGPRPVSRQEIAEITGLGIVTVCRWIRMLRNARLVYVAEYRRKAKVGNYIELFRFGYMFQDELRPKRLSNAEYKRRSKLKGK